jgi:hypothetical protein
MDHKEDRVDKCNCLLKLMWSTGWGVLDGVFTKDESAVSFHTSKTKQQSKQFLRIGQAGRFKAKVHAS